MAPGILLPSPPLTALRPQSSSPARLDASCLYVARTEHPSAIPPAHDLAFGKHLTGKLDAASLCPSLAWIDTAHGTPPATDFDADHMLQIEWTEAHGWQQPCILPYQDIHLDPTASVFHYGFECFEGMKVYRDAKGHLRLFRPEMNLDRFNKSAVRIALPSLDTAELLKLIAEFVKIEERFVLGYNLARSSFFFAFDLDVGNLATPCIFVPSWSVPAPALGSPHRLLPSYM